MMGVNFKSIPFFEEDSRKAWNERNGPTPDLPARTESVRYMLEINNPERWKELAKSLGLKFYDIVLLENGHQVVSVEASKNQFEHLRSSPFVTSMEYGRGVGPTGPSGLLG
jgi:hypothetical protein